VGYLTKEHCEECSDISTHLSEHRDLKGLRDNIFKLRYAANDRELWSQCSERVAAAISSIEPNGKRQKWFNDFFTVLRDFHFIPGGRILRNAGKNKGMLLNCFGLGVEDNIDSIGQLIKDALVISKYGGGIGFECSQLRPEGAPLVSQGNNSFSSGVISFVDVVDYALNTIKGGGDRRAAGLTFMGVWHPEIYNFIGSKVKEGKLANFNISVGITNDFIQAVKKDKDWDLTFTNKVYKTVKARDLWNHIIQNAWKCGDPGLLNLDNIYAYNPLYYCETSLTPNPCGELLFPPYNACDLGCINLVKIYDKEKGVVWKLLKRIVYIAVRFLDNVLDVTHYPMEQIERNARSTRRIGLGVMGLHYLMLRMGINDYGSKDSIEFMEELLSRIRNYAYEASIELAKEKGAFEKFEAGAYLDGAFCKTLPRRIRKDIELHGLRNATLLSMPPTGTTSLVAGVSQGIEPIFNPIYKRKYYEASKKKQVVEMDALFKEFVLNGQDTKHFIGAYDISPEKHMEVQVTAQQYVDNSISKTINLKKDFPAEKLSKILLDHIQEVKGVTIYREGSKGEEILIPCDYKLSKDKLRKLAETA
jgi:ribonucleoside-diphosphate reductase alpha chain